MLHIREFELTPRTEGRTHINIGAGSRSLLGRMLANDAPLDINHPRHGHFCSLEGYWAYVKSGCVKSPLRASEYRLHEIHGAEAVKQSSRVVRRDQPDFRQLICEALELKIERHGQLKIMLVENQLDLLRYEVLDGEALLNPNQKWFMDHLEQIVQRLKCRRRSTKTLSRG